MYAKVSKGEEPFFPSEQVNPTRFEKISASTCDSPSLLLPFSIVLIDPGRLELEADFSQELYETSIIRDNVSFFRAMLLRVFPNSISHSNLKILLDFHRCFFARKSFNVTRIFHNLLLSQSIFVYALFQNTTFKISIRMNSHLDKKSGSLNTDRQPFTFLRRRKKSQGGLDRKWIRYSSSVSYPIMVPWGYISHGVTARWSIEFLSPPFGRDLGRNEAPMGSHERNQHLPTVTAPLQTSLLLSTRAATVLTNVGTNTVVNKK